MHKWWRWVLYLIQVVILVDIIFRQNRLDNGVYVSGHSIMIVSLYLILLTVINLLFYWLRDRYHRMPQ